MNLRNVAFATTAVIIIDRRYNHCASAAMFVS
jgi:hypothetical protein